MEQLFNSAQRSSLTIGLRAFEMHLRQADACLQSEPEEGILYRRKVNLAPEQRAAIRAQIAVALAEIAHLARKFELTRFNQDFGASFAGQMSVDWSSLCDLSANKLRRYGDVNPQLAAQLDSDIERLIELASSLANLASVRTKP